MKPYFAGDLTLFHSVILIAVFLILLWKEKGMTDKMNIIPCILQNWDL